MPDSLHAALDAQRSTRSTRTAAGSSGRLVLGRSFRREVINQKRAATTCTSTAPPLDKLDQFLEADGPTRLRFPQLG